MMKLSTTKTTGYFTYAVISDIHLGHRRVNSTKEIIDNLDVALSGYKEDTYKLDAIFLAGDIFDGILKTTLDEFVLILSWFSRLYNFCGKHDIILRVLEGTPSHDWGQAKIFQPIVEHSTTPVDYKYIRSVAVEELYHGVKVLYIPDEWNNDPNVTFKDAVEQMRLANTDKVDIAIMHGAFGFQFPKIKLPFNAHDENKYLGIVNHYIHIGHDHKRKSYDRIYVQGSFDRLCHGEEDSKGFSVSSISENKTFDKTRFIANKGAKLYITLTLPNNDPTEGFKYLDKEIAKLPLDSYVRIKGKNNSIVGLNIQDLKARYIQYNISIAPIKSKTELMTGEVVEVDTYRTIDINPNTILGLIEQELAERLVSSNIPSHITKEMTTRLMEFDNVH